MLNKSQKRLYTTQLKRLEKRLAKARKAYPDADVQAELDRGAASLKALRFTLTGEE